MGIKRFIAYYSLKDELLVGTNDISHLDADEIKNLLNIEGDEHLLYSYEIFNADGLCKYLEKKGLSFDFGSYSYFLEATGDLG